LEENILNTAKTAVDKYFPTDSHQLQKLIISTVFALIKIHEYRAEIVTAIKLISAESEIGF